MEQAITPQEVEQLRAHADAFADGYSGHFGIRLRDARWQKVRDTHLAALVLERAAEVCRDKYREHRNGIEYEGGLGEGANWCAETLRNMAKGLG